MDFNKENLLDFISESSIFKEVSSKLKDRKELNEMNSKVEFKLKKSASTPSRKVRVLIQAFAQRIDIKNFDLRAEAKDIQQACSRLLRCVLVLFLERKRGFEAKLCIQWLTSIARQSSLETPYSIFQQVHGISKRQAQEFVEKGVFTLKQLKSKRIEFFRDLKGKHKGDYFNRKMVNILNCVPSVKITLDQDDRGQSIQVKLKVIGEAKCPHFYHKRMMLLVKKSNRKLLFWRFVQAGDPNNNSFEITVSKKDLPLETSIHSLFYFDLVHKQSIFLKGGEIINSSKAVKMASDNQNTLDNFFQSKSDNMMVKNLKDRKLQKQVQDFSSKDCRNFDCFIKELNPLTLGNKENQIIKPRKKKSKKPKMGLDELELLIEECNHGKKRLGFLEFVPRKKTVKNSTFPRFSYDHHQVTSIYSNKEAPHHNSPNKNLNKKSNMVSKKREYLRLFQD